MEIVTESRRALRGVLSRPFFTAAVLAALGLGIGLSTAIFSLVHAVLLRSLPYRDPERIVRVWESRPRMGPDSAQIAAFSMDHFRAWRESTEVFDAMAVYQDRSFNLTGGSEPLRVQAQSVSPSLFSLLGVEPLLGRAFSKEEETPGRDRVAVLSHGLWQRVFGGDEAVLERTIQLDGEAYDVLGVMPRTFRFPDPGVELWVPLADANPEPLPPGAMRIELVPVVAKLREGVSIERAEAAGTSFLDGYRRTSPAPPELERDVSIHLTSLHDQLARPIRPALLVLFVAVTFVLLIICANVANLFLARGESRETEMALRSALGAGRSRLARQLLAESLVYALLGRRPRDRRRHVLAPAWSAPRSRESLARGGRARRAGPRVQPRRRAPDRASGRSPSRASGIPGGRRERIEGERERRATGALLAKCARGRRGRSRPGALRGGGIDAAKLHESRPERSRLRAPERPDLPPQSSRDEVSGRSREESFLRRPQSEALVASRRRRLGVRQYASARPGADGDLPRYRGSASSRGPYADAACERPHREPRLLPRHGNPALLRPRFRRGGPGRGPSRSGCQRVARATLLRRR